MQTLWNTISASWRRSLRFAALGLHLAAGLAITTWIFPRESAIQRKQRIHRWSQQLLRIIGLHLRVHGQAANTAEPVMLLSNHVSWLDIYALNALSPARFVAKSDVRNWPVIGRLCEHTGTLFVDRHSKHDAHRVNAEIALALREGCDVALFPEGTTTDGSLIRSFRSALLQGAVDNHALVQPLYLRYLDARGNPTALPAYFGEITMGQSLWRLLGARGLQAEIHFLPPLRTGADTDRRELARQAEALVRQQHEQLEEPAVRRHATVTPATLACNT